MVTGLTELISKLDNIGRSASADGGSILFEIGEKIMGVAQERTPYLTGKLMRSGKVLPPTVRGDVTSVILSFGDDSADYAIAVHERLGVRHKHGQAKFLESAVLDSEPHIANEIAYRMMEIWTKK